MLGDSSMVTLGDSSMVTLGDSSMVTLGDSSMVTVGDSLMVTLGDSSMVTLGDSSMVTLGDSSERPRLGEVLLVNMMVLLDVCAGGALVPAAAFSVIPDATRRDPRTT